MIWLLIAIGISPFVWIFSEWIAKKIKAEISPKPHKEK